MNPRTAFALVLLAAIACDADAGGPPAPDSDDPTEVLGDAHLFCAHPDTLPFRCDAHYGSVPIVEGWAEILCLGGVVVDACSPDAASNFAGACWVEGEMAGEWTVTLSYSYGITVEAAEANCEASGDENSGVQGLSGRSIFFAPW